MIFRLSHDLLYNARVYKVDDQLLLRPVRIIVRTVPKMASGRIHVYACSGVGSGFRAICSVVDDTLSLGFQEARLRDVLPIHSGALKPEELQVSATQTIRDHKNPRMLVILSMKTPERVRTS